MKSVFAFFQGLIFVVDSNDRERAPEAQEELSKMVRHLFQTLLSSMTNLPLCLNRNKVIPKFSLYIKTGTNVLSVVNQN